MERFPSIMVLDLLLAVQMQYDAALGFRYSCRVAMCGTCTVRVNGQAVLACQTAVDPAWTEVRLEPLAGLPIVRDLIVDMGPFFEQWGSIKPYISPSPGLVTPAPIAPDAPERRLIDPSLNCITCGACYSNSVSSGRSPRLLSPAALTRASVLVADSRDEATSERLDLVGGHAEEDHMSLYCPKGLDLGGAIEALRRRRKEERG